MTWGALYLSATHGLDIKGLGGAIFVIYAVGVVGEFAGGLVTDRLRNTFTNTNKVMRTELVILAFCIAVPMYLLSSAPMSMWPLPSFPYPCFLRNSSAVSTGPCRLCVQTVNTAVLSAAS